MRKTCKFCRHGSPDEEGRKPIIHNTDCARDDENAEELYEEGYLIGRRNSPYAENERTLSRAWKAGWLCGDAAHDAWFNGCDSW